MVARYRTKKYSDVAKSFTPYGLEVKEAARKLENFLASDEGVAAYELLDASSLRIDLNLNVGSAGHAACLCASGLVNPFTGEPLPQKTEFVVMLATSQKYGGRVNHPSEILRFIRAELDKIAQDIDKPDLK